MLKTIIRRRATVIALRALLPAAAVLCAPVALTPLGLTLTRAANAQSVSTDSAFVRDLGKNLVGVVNGPGSTADKKVAILPMLNQDVDVDAIGRFCLGRFWHLATPDQQQRYLKLFHQVLVNSITGKLGDYRGVQLNVGQSHVQDGKSYVETMINRPSQPEANVQWVVSDASGSPRVVDIVAEGVSLSLTQRSDYASYLARNGNNIDALLNAMTRQVSRAS